MDPLVLSNDRSTTAVRTKSAYVLTQKAIQRLGLTQALPLVAFGWNTNALVLMNTGHETYTKSTSGLLPGQVLG